MNNVNIDDAKNYLRVYFCASLGISLNISLHLTFCTLTLVSGLGCDNSFNISVAFWSSVESGIFVNTFLYRLQGRRGTTIAEVISVLER